VVGYYDLWTVFCSFVIAFLAGFAAFESVDHVRAGALRQRWVFFGGVTLGLGIWSMHFVGMLAWHPPFPLFYAVDRTVLSVLAAICASWLALYLVTDNLAGQSLFRRGLGALLVGAGICSMHYIGMTALGFSGRVMWDVPWLLCSFAIAVTASWAAMALLARGGDGMKDLTPRLMASAGIAVAICGMHYAGMRAFMPEPGAMSLRMPASFSGVALARIGVGNAMLFTFALLVVSYRDKARWIQRAGAARMESAEAARKLEALAAAGKIAASVAHEINNPLEAVTNLLYLVQMGNVGEREREYLEMAQKEVGRIASITTHTLRFYRQQSGPSPVSIPDLLESALVLFQTQLTEQKITLEREWPENTPQIVCREGEIRQVIANLISNAIDAMPDGGKLRLGVKPVPKGLEVEVADTGRGIPAEVRSRILEPFFTTKGCNGTGLGLSISAEILARHGGRLDFESEADGNGTCFRFFLPFTQEAAVSS
jgi:signal transduction histidine kinase